MSLSELSEGRKVQLSDGREAVVRFAGQTSFAPGLWIGIELDDASGKNDGSVQGTRYFDCQIGHGMFVRPTSLKVLPGAPAPFVPLPKKKARPASTTSSKGSAPPDPTLGRRVSVNSVSPTPAPKQAARVPGIRVSTNHPSLPPAPDALADRRAGGQTRLAHRPCCPRLMRSALLTPNHAVGLANAQSPPDSLVPPVGLLGPPLLPR